MLKMACQQRRWYLGRVISRQDMSFFSIFYFYFIFMKWWSFKPLAIAILYSSAITTTRASDALELVPRFQHSMEVVNGELCVFGGKSTSTGTGLSDFLLDYRCVDVTKSIYQKWPQWKKQSSASRFAMPPLAQHSSIYDQINHIVVPYGGQKPAYFSQANYLSVFCTKFLAWGASKVVDTEPRRYLHTAVLQESSHDMILFGGASDNTTDDTTKTRWNNVSRMVLNGDSHAIHQAPLNPSISPEIYGPGTVLVDNGDITPEPIRGIVQHASVLVDKKQMVVLGGNVFRNKEGVGLPFDEIYVYDVDKMKWSSKKCTGDIPPPRSVLQASVHNETDIYIYGGVDIQGWSKLFGDLYKLDTKTWQWSKMPSLYRNYVPAPRYAHQMRTLGHYLIITHGFIESPNGTMLGDKDMYFYDLNKRSFVNTYSPEGLSKRDLDTFWVTENTDGTRSVIAICLLFTIATLLVSMYYMYKEGILFIRKRRSRLNNQGILRHPRRGSVGIGGGSGGGHTRRSLIPSYYTDTIRSSVYSVFSGSPNHDNKKDIGAYRQSIDTDGTTTLASPFMDRFFGRNRRGSKDPRATLDGESIPLDKLGSTDNRKPRARSNSASEGTLTVIESDKGHPLQNSRTRNPNALPENMRHTHVIDEVPGDMPYINRKLTLSSQLPTYNLQRHSNSVMPTLRFSDRLDIEENDSISLSTPSSSISLNRKLELSVISEQEEYESKNENKGLRIANVQ